MGVIDGLFRLLRHTCRNENVKIKLNNVNIFCTRIIHEWNESFKQYLITKHLDLPGLIKQLYNITMIVSCP